MDTPLPTTSYAVLGLLAVRSWTGYELAQQARRSLSHFWPKEESVFYSEPRRLVERGLATVSLEREGRRERRRYEITEVGREALREWLAKPSQPPRLELEPLLRLFFADQGEVSDAQDALVSLRAWAVEGALRAREVAVTYQANRAETYRADPKSFPERRHVNVLAGCLIADLYLGIIEFVDAATVEVASWSSGPDVELGEAGLRMLAERFARGERVLGAGE